MEERNNMCYGVDMSREEWRTKPEWKGYYEFSNWGRCRSLDRPLVYKDGRQGIRKGKIVKVNEWGQVATHINGTIKYITLYYVIAELFISDYIEGTPITPIDGNRQNCRLDNLFIGAVGSTSDSLKLSISNNEVQHIPVIEGGFAEGERVLFDITLARYAGKDVVDLRTWNICPNLPLWEKGIDYIDLKEYANINDYIPLLLDLGYVTQAISKSEHIFIFSERGVAKVMSTLKNSNPAKWEFLNNFVNEYFNMREQIKNQVPQLTRKQQLQLQLFSDDEMEVVAAHKELLKLEVQEATAPLLDTIEEQAPKVDKFDRYMESDGTYNATNTAKLLNISSAQKFNNLLKDEKIQYRSGKNWVLYSKYQWLIDEGYCKYIEGENSNYSYIQLRWYPKGVDWLRTQLQEQVI